MLYAYGTVFKKTSNKIEDRVNHRQHVISHGFSQQVSVTIIGVCKRCNQQK